MQIIKRPKRKVRVVIFDVDRTLYPKRAEFFTRGQRREIMVVAQKWSVSFHEAKRRIKERQKKLSRSKKGRKKRKVTRTEALISLGISKHWWNKVRKNCWKPRGELKPNRRVIAIVEDLAQELRLVAASNATRPMSMRTLDVLHILPFFKVVWGPDSAGEAKHHIVYWQRLARRLKIRPRNCVVVGDRREADCDPAIRAGFGGAILVRGPSDLWKVRQYLLNNLKK
ncbi:HAD family hydrolase [Candidatus Uhrbacteria bacterium]|nr:HAD family hydrolase [Candidatus Uhrbacteria bacterium]